MWSPRLYPLRSPAEGGTATASHPRRDSRRSRSGTRPALAEDLLVRGQPLAHLRVVADPRPAHPAEHLALVHLVSVPRRRLPQRAALLLVVPLLPVLRALVRLPVHRDLLDRC